MVTAIDTGDAESHPEPDLPHLGAKMGGGIDLVPLGSHFGSRSEKS